VENGPDNQLPNDEKWLSSDWRLVLHGAGTAEWNMAVDEALFESYTSGKIAATLRIYRWDRPSISLGRFQPVERTIDVAAVSEKGIPLVRRITGGRGILHGDDLTFSIVCSHHAIGLTSHSPLSEVYFRFTALMTDAFALAGCAARQGQEYDRVGRALARAEAHGDCFATQSEADVVSERTGNKIMGGALHRRGDALLLQASAPLYSVELRDTMYTLSSEVFRGSGIIPSSAPITPIPFEALRSALIEALSKRTYLIPKRSDLTANELAMTVALISTRYHSEAWKVRARLLQSSLTD